MKIQLYSFIFFIFNSSIGFSADELIMATSNDIREFDQAFVERPKVPNQRNEGRRRNFEKAEQKFLQGRPLPPPLFQQKRLQADGPQRVGPLLGEIRQRQRQGRLPPPPGGNPPPP